MEKKIGDVVLFHDVNDRQFNGLVTGMNGTHVNLIFVDEGGAAQARSDVRPARERVETVLPGMENGKEVMKVRTAPCEYWRE